MTDDQSNQIEDLQSQPEDTTEESIVEIVECPIDEPTKEPVKGPLKELVDMPQIEVRVAPQPKPDISDDSGHEDKKALTLKVMIFTILFVLIFIGIILTFRIIPTVISYIPSVTQPLGALFISKTDTKTSNNTGVSVATSTVTTKPTVVPTTKPVVSQKPISQKPVVSQKIAPASLVSNIISITNLGTRTIVKFNVQNTGDVTSDIWSFSASLPSTATPKYYSEQQYPIEPKSGIVFTLGFDQNQSINTPVTITLYTQQGIVN